MKKNVYKKIGYIDAVSFEDVVIVPQYSEIRTRKEVDTSFELNKNLKIEVPVLCANMDSLCEKEMCVALYKVGALGVMHRFFSVEENVKQYKEVVDAGCNCVVSVGVNRDSKDRTEALFNAGAKYFCIDVAHGDHILMKEMIEWMREKYSNEVFIIAGNVGTENGVQRLETWGADMVKVGLSLGASCITRTVTGVSTPAISTLIKCVEVAKKPLIWDGGIKTSGDVAKAIGMGASLVMVGSLFAGTDETPHVQKIINKKKEIENLGDDSEVAYLSAVKELEILEQNIFYRGNASAGTMLKFRPKQDMPTPEGREIKVTRKGPAKDVIYHLRDGLRSAMSYSNSKTLKEFNEKCYFSFLRTRV